MVFAVERLVSLEVFLGVLEGMLELPDAISEQPESILEITRILKMW